MILLECKNKWPKTYCASVANNYCPVTCNRCGIVGGKKDLSLHLCQINVLVGIGIFNSQNIYLFYLNSKLVVAMSGTQKIIALV